MAYIKYLPQDEIPEGNRINDLDNIVQIHGIHSKVMVQHMDLYLELMHKKGTLRRIQRELIGVVVSTINECHY
ncbi:hypothetical protein ACFL6E_07600 [Candidatus Neomarinimicrobiota bacterium]